MSVYFIELASYFTNVSVSNALTYSAFYIVNMFFYIIILIHQLSIKFNDIEEICKHVEFKEIDASTK